MLDGIVELPVSNPTSVAFGGPRGADLYITTSWFDLDDEARTAQPLAGGIFRVSPGTTGRPASPVAACAMCS
jgi:sugar lactone lactonase YvrE